MRSVIAIAAIALAACSSGRPSASEVDLNAAAIQAQDDIDNYAAGRSARRLAAVAHGSSRVEPPAAVVSRYYALIGARHFAAAWGLWGHHGAACRRTSAQFAASLAPLTGIAVEVGGEQDAEAGAGQRHVTLPVSLNLSATPNAPARAEARVILHRVADGIDTTDPDDHQWRITGMTIVPASNSALAATRDLLLPCGSASG